MFKLVSYLDWNVTWLRESDIRSVYPLLKDVILERY